MQQFVNNWASTLSAQALAADLQMVVASADAARIAAASVEDFYRATIEDDAGTLREIVRITAANAGTGEITVERAQEGTVARDWPAGTLMEIRVTAQTLADLQQSSAPPGSTFDPDTIVTNGDSVLVDSNGNVLVNA